MIPPRRCDLAHLLTTLHRHLRHPGPALYSLAGRLAGLCSRDLHTRLSGSDGVYLTFDDGPDPHTTPLILDELNRVGAQATFFFIGENAAAHPALVRATREAGHTVGQHSHTHIDPWRSRKEAVLEEMDRATAVLEDISGVPVGWMRPPYGHLTASLLRWCRAHEQRMALWDLMPGDFLPRATATSISARVISGFRAGSIVVLHEGARFAEITPDVVRAVVRRVSDRGLACKAL